MINWILQKNLTKSEALSRIKLALKEDQEGYEEIEVRPFSNELPEILNRADNLVVYGSTTLMLNAYKDRILKSGVFYDPSRFQMKNYVDKWGENTLNYKGQLIRFGELLDRKLDGAEHLFIRPNHDKKEFGGRVDQITNLRNWAKKIIDLQIPELHENTEIWISKPEDIIKEWRIFIVDNQIVSSSRYLYKGELSESATDAPEEMMDFVKSRLDEYRLADIYVMDIAEIAIGYKIIECNCFNGTGFYQHDIGKIVKSVNDYLRSKNEA